MHAPRSTLLGLALAILGTASAYNPIFRENEMSWRDLFLQYDKAERESEVESYDLSYLTFEQRDRLKSVADIEELANLTGLPLLDEEPNEGLRIGFRSLSPPVRTRRRRQFESFPKCQPRIVIEPVEQHHDGRRILPTCIERKVCGGCCNATPGRLCVATKTKKVTKMVMQLGTNSLTPVLLNVTEDEECECACKIKGCPDTHRQEYDAKNCMCKCKSSLQDEKAQCEGVGNFWDYETCRCVCRSLKKRECSSGYFFNELTCSCLPLLF